MYGFNFSFGHFNQHTSVRGEIEPGDNASHRWRRWARPFLGTAPLAEHLNFYRLFLANLGEGRGFMLLKITNAQGLLCRLLRAAGRWRVRKQVLDMDLMTDWTIAKIPTRVQISVRTARRTALIEGEIVMLAPLRNRRKIDGETGGLAHCRRPHQGPMGRRHRLRHDRVHPTP